MIPLSAPAPPSQPEPPTVSLVNGTTAMVSWLFPQSFGQIVNCTVTSTPPQGRVATVPFPLSSTTAADLAVGVFVTFQVSCANDLGSRCVLVLTAVPRRGRGSLLLYAMPSRPCVCIVISTVVYIVVSIVVCIVDNHLGVAVLWWTLCPTTVVKLAICRPLLCSGFLVTPLVRDACERVLSAVVCQPAVTT